MSEQGPVFRLSKTEWERYKAWIAQVRAKNPEWRTAIGGAETFSFTPTSIGVVVKVDYLGESIDLTDYESW